MLNWKSNSPKVAVNFLPWFYCSQCAAAWNGGWKLQSVLHPWCVSACLTVIRAANKDGIGLHMPVRSLENRTSQLQNISWLQITKTPVSNSHICINTGNLRHTSILLKMYRQTERQTEIGLIGLCVCVRVQSYIYMWPALSENQAKVIFCDLLFSTKKKHMVKNILAKFYLYIFNIDWVR